MRCMPILPRRMLLITAASLALSGLDLATTRPRGLAQGSGDLLPLTEIIARVAKRYEGRMIDVEIKPGKRHEQLPVVYELRWLTPAGAVLKIRLDAATGDILEIDGRGQLDALRPKS